MIIVFEGLDGSGKETQTKLIEKRLNDIGLKTIRIEFPNYCNKYSLFVKEYLNGDFGNNLNPYLISTFFGLDRFGVYKREMSRYIDEGYFILCDRYIYSNLIYQGSLIDNEDDRDKFFKWVLEFEYDICGLPKENMTFFMNLSLDINLDMIKKRNNKDIYEKDYDFIIKCYKTAQYVCSMYDFINIECDDGKSLFSIQSINEKIYSKILNKIGYKG